VHGHTLSIGQSDSINNVLNNDTDPQNLPLTATLVTPPSDGALTFRSDGTFTYVPNNPNFVGTDTFTYTASNGIKTSQPATVTIDITDQAPIAQSQAVFGVISVAEATPGNPTQVGCELASDGDPDGDSTTHIPTDASGDPLTPDSSGFTPTGHGTVQLNADGSFLYKPNLGFIGYDRFYYVVSDGVMDSNVGSFTIQVWAVQPRLVNVFSDRVE
jgi:hypothetical protein